MGEIEEKKYSINEMSEKKPCVAYMTGLNEARQIIYVSPQIEAMLGFSMEEWSADPDLCFRQLHYEDRERVLAEVHQSYNEGKPFRSEYRLLARDGRIVWVHDEAIVVRDEGGRPRFMQGIMFDISEDKRKRRCYGRGNQDFERSLKRWPSASRSSTWKVRL